MTEQELYNYLFDYNNGHIYWKNKSSIYSTINIGDIAESLQTDASGLQHYSVRINRMSKQVHRVIWIMHFGDIPEELEVDHIYHDRLDNKIENLRLVTKPENAKNKSKYKSNTSGHANISIRKDNYKKKFRVSFNSKNENNYSKCFLTLEEAIQHRDEKYIEFGFHKNHGK